MSALLRKIAVTSDRWRIHSGGRTNILAAGAPEAIEKARPLLDVLGKKTWIMGFEPAQANAAKIAANMMITMAIEAMAEAIVLTQDNGVAPEAFLEMILGTLFAGRAYESYSVKILADDYESGFRMRLGLKDLNLATAAGAKTGRDLPMLEAVRARMAAAVEAGMGGQGLVGHRRLHASPAALHASLALLKVALRRAGERRAARLTRFHA